MATVNTQKITVTLPKPLLERLDALIPTHQRSDFIVQAVREQLAILEQAQAVDEAAGAWSDEAYPELSDNTAIETWLAKLRSGWQRQEAG
ncbi:MAG: hypothetical protein L0332_11260 [Chloroflexi bacterium]|nr:hypothetical protein [Chloroflexota bacterium]MCI0645982.1 hypothetical protein [Chloroflexota bacterium]MCI0727286.1 hypothetical protein [Chloroflexota bacterium]